MASENLVEVRFGANVEGIRNGAREAGGHVDGLLGHLKDFKSETVQTGRQARFFARELAEIIPAAEGVKGILRDVFAVGLAGGGIGAVVESAKLLAGVFHELGEEERKAGEDYKKFVEDSKKQTEQLHVAVQKMLLELQGATRAQLLLYDQTHEAHERERQKLDELTKAESDLVLAKNDEVAIDAFGMLFRATDIEAREKQIVKLRSELKAIQDIIKAKKEEIEPVAKADAEKERLKKFDEYLELEFADFKQARLDENVVSAQIASADLAMRLKLFEEEQRREQQIYEDALKQEFDDLRKIREEESIVDPGRAARDMARIQKEQQKTIDDWKKVGEEIGSAMARTVSGIITGTQSIGDAFANLAQRLLDMALDKIFQGIFGALFGGGPLGGLLGGILPFEEGGSIITAAAGADVPRVGGPFPALLHKGETVITHATTDRLDAFLERAEQGGGGGGGDIHVHLHGTLIDGAGVEKFFRSNEARRAVSQMRRLGEWPG